MKTYQQMLADIDIAEARDTGQNATRERFREFSNKAAEEVKSRIARADAGLGDFTPYELLFSAAAHCVCGAGLAYPEDIGVWGGWSCSAILMGQAQAGTEHSPAYPFNLYDIKSERVRSVVVRDRLALILRGKSTGFV